MSIISTNLKHVCFSCDWNRIYSKFHKKQFKHDRKLSRNDVLLFIQYQNNLLLGILWKRKTYFEKNIKTIIHWNFILFKIYCLVSVRLAI